MANFKDIIGQKQAKEHFQTAIETGNISHAYIINGETGSGRRMLADAFAKALQCEKHPNADSCDGCKSCHQAESGNHPDIRYITHEKASISVDDIREQLNNDIQIKPYSSEHKVYIIPEANKMTEQAQNALLKTIEEPPAYAVIILLTDNLNALLPTIKTAPSRLLSRRMSCQLFPCRQSPARKSFSTTYTLAEVWTKTRADVFGNWKRFGAKIPRTAASSRNSARS